MSTQTVTTTGVGALPRVNLMPPEIAEAERFRQVQLGMGVAVLAAVMAVGGLYLHEKSGVSAAQSQVDAASAQQTSLNTTLNSLASVKNTYAAVQAKQALLSQAMGQEVRWSFVLNGLALRIPDHVWLTGVTATETTAPGATVAAPTTTAAPATTTGVATTAGIGSLTFDVTAFRHNDVATWLDALARQKGFDSPSFTSSTEATIGTRGVVNAITSTGLTSALLSNRYAPKTGK